MSTTAHAQTPVITAQSEGRQVVTVGQNITLSVTATGATSYQWKRNGLAVAGATAASYAITSAVPVRDNGWYQAIASNANGATTSAVVFVNVAVAPVNIAAWGANNDDQTTVPTGLTNVVALAAGSRHSLALKADGTVVAWGSNSSGQTTVPTGLSNVVALSAGSGHSLALKADGTVAAWGANFFGQATVPAGLTNVVALAGGDYHSLALKADGTVVVWGSGSLGQTAVPTGLTTVVALASGGIHSLVLKADGTVVAWGNNGYGQATVPTGLTNVVALAAGDRHGLALKADGTVVAWGDNGYSQTTVPTGLANVVAVAGGGRHSLALKADGTVVAWGTNSDGQAAIPTGLTRGLGLAAGYTHSLVLSQGDVAPTITVISAPRQVVSVGQNLTLSVTATGATSFQWKRNGLAVAGATNASYAITSAAPAREGGWYQAVATNGTASTASAAVFVNVAVVQSNIVAWGYNNYGQTTVPTGLTDVVGIAEGHTHTLALKGDGTVVAWGDNSVGQATVPTGLINVVGIAAGYACSLALKADGTVVAWGNNYGATTVPTGLTNVVAVATGGDYSLALKADGTVVAWGDNRSGQTTVPARLTNVAAIAAGGNHSLALKADGTVVAWGVSSYGAATVPIGLTNVVAIAAGGSHSLALKADGTVVAWGSNYYGETTVPTRLTNVVALAAGAYHSLALKADGSVVAWGENRFGYGETTVPAWLGGGFGLAAGWFSSFVLRDSAGDVAPTIRRQPAVLTAFTGQDVTLSVDATGGTALLAYQWRKGGIAVSGATDATLSFPLVTSASAGDYDVVMTNQLGTVTSSVATLTVSATAGVSINLAGRQVVAAGQNLTLAATAAIPGPVTYQWRRNGRAISGATAAGYTITSAAPMRDNGWYQAVATNGTVSTTSAVVFISVAVLPANVFGWGSNSYGQSTVPPLLTDVVALAAGGAHNLALKADGSVVAWGDNSHGQATVPPGLTDVVALAAAGGTSLALKADGTVVAWGYNSFGQTMVPTGLTNVVAVSAGGDHSLALKADGTVVAWGREIFGQPVPKGLNSVVAIAAGYDYSLALKADGMVVAWGRQDYDATKVPAELNNVTAIAAGGDHGFALRGDGTVVTWGFYGSYDAPVPPGLANVVAIAAGFQHTVALKADGSVVAWGDDSNGETTLSPGPLGALGLAAGFSHSLVLRNPVGDLLPTIATQPVSQVAATRLYVSLSVVATAGTAPLTYQWRKDSVAIDGATRAAWTFRSMSPGIFGSYDVVVSNYLGSVVSHGTFVNVVDRGAAATHAVTRSGYVAGGTVTIMNTLNFAAGATNVRWQVQLPAGWSYASSDGTAATTMPAVGASGLLEWIWSTPPASPIAFSFTLQVPTGTSGAFTLTATPSLLVNGGTVTIMAQPDPLTINPAGGKHSADTDGDGKISLAELTRVIELYNARTGTVRTGRYLVATTATDDGFGPDAGNATAALARYHSADTNRDGRLRLTELTRVIELFNARVGGTRTGAYHVQAGTEDDFTPGT